MDKSWDDVRKIRKLVGKKKTTSKKKSKTPSRIRRSDKLKKYILKQRNELKNQLIKIFESKFI